MKKSAGCGACGLFKDCITPKMEVTGDGEKEILFLAEAPGEQEDKRGKQLVGAAGKELRETLKRRNISLDRDCWKINAINCRPIGDDGYNRTPTDKEIEYCHPRIWKVIEEKKPKLIILLGGIALRSFLHNRWKEKPGGIMGWRGWIIPDVEIGAWVVPTFHPSYVIRSEGQPVIERIFRRDIGKALRQLDVSLPPYGNLKSGVSVLEDPEEVKEHLKVIYDSKPKALAIDYETSGLKPWDEGHYIKCMSMSPENGVAVSFLMSRKVIPLVSKILRDGKIGKIAQNLAHEDRWTRAILRKQVRPWIWDTMWASQVLDNRVGGNGLKFQAYVRYGLLDYSSHIDKFLSPLDEDTKLRGSNALNRIEEANVEDLLMYCGMDSLLTRKLALDQMEEFGVFPWEL